MESHRNQILLGASLRKTSLSAKQLELCYGAMMGDSSITLRPSGAARFRMSHCEKQKEYLEWKASILRPFIIQENATQWTSSEKRFDNSICPPLTAYCYETICHGEFLNFYGLFYETVKGKKRKRLTMTILNRLTPFSIFIWFLDDGCYCHQEKNSTHIMYLSTYRYTLSEHKTLKKWFWHKWRINAVITYDSNHKRYITRFNREAQNIFYKTFIYPFIDQCPTCMLYKIPNF